MRLLLLGASGRTGRHVTAQALDRGHSVTALVRAAPLNSSTSFKTVVADPCCVADLLSAIRGQDAVISCLGHRSGGSPWLVRDAAIAMLTAMRETDSKRYLAISGALLYPSYNPLLFLLKTMMSERLADARAMESALRVSNANWTVVRPPHLREGDHKKGYHIQSGDRPGLTWGLQFRDLADCLLDLAENHDYARQVVGVASA